MGSYLVTGPDGKKYKVTGQGSPEEALRAVQSMVGAKPSRNQGVMGQINAGIAGFAKGLGELGAAIPNAALGMTERLMRGESGQSDITLPRFRPDAAPAMRAAGVPVAEGEPQNWKEAALRGVGEGAGALIPGSALVKLGRAGGAVASGIANQVAQPFINTPVRAMGAELAAASAGRASGQATADAGYPEYAPIAELGGGLAAGLGPAAIQRGIINPIDDAMNNAPGLIGSAYRAVTRQVVPYSGRGARTRASDRIVELTADPEKAAANLSDDSILSPAQQSGDPRLARLERSVAETDPRLEDQFSADNAARRSQLEADMRGTTRTAQDAQAAMGDRRDVFQRTLQTAIERAQEKAQQELAAIPPARRPSANASIVRQQIETALQDAKKTEDVLWSRVPMDAAVPTGRAAAALQNVVQNTGRAQMDDVPRKALELLDPETGLGSTTTTREMHALYSDLRQMARNSRAGTNPNPNRARIADEIADAILEDLGATTSPTSDVGAAVNEARTFSRVLHETFDQGEVGTILTRTNAGGDRVANELTLSGIDAGDIKAAVTVDDIRRAVGQGGDEAIADYVRGRFESAAIINGQLNPARAQTFLTRNRELLDRYPQIEVQLRAAVKAEETARRTAKVGAERAKAVADPRKSPGAAFVSANYGKELERSVFGAQDPARAALALRREAAKNPVALDGIKGAVVDYMIGQGRPISEQLADPRIGRAIRTLVTGPELSRIQAVARDYDKLIAAMAQPALQGPIVDDAANTVMTYAARILAARQGAAAGGSGGASIQTANMASSRVKAILGNLTADQSEAIIRSALFPKTPEDKALLGALLRRENVSGPTARMAENRIIEWLAGYTATQMSEDENAR